MAAIDPVHIGELHLPGIEPVPLLAIPLTATPTGVVGGTYTVRLQSGAPRLTPAAAEALRWLLDTFPEEPS